MTAQNKSQLAPVRAPIVHLTQFRDGQGNKMDVEQSFRLTDVTETDFGDKKKLEGFFGSGEYANGLVTSQSELTFTLTVGSLGGAILNALTMGREVQTKQRLKGTATFTVPQNVATFWKIKNIIGLNVARWDSTTSLKIGATTLTAVAYKPTVAGTYQVVNGWHYFAPDDVNKTAVLEYVSNGTTIKTTFKILAKLSFNVGGFADNAPRITINDNNRTRQAFDMSKTPALYNYMGTGGGVIYINPNEELGGGKKMTISHWTDGQTVSSSLAALPDAGFYFYIDAPGGSAFVADSGVELSTDATPAETGLSVGDPLEKITTGTLATGQYMNDTKGWYQFMATDTQDIVLIRYVPDYFSYRPILPDSAAFVESLGVYKSDGSGLTRVAITAPLSIGTDQFTVDASGLHNFDFTNTSDTFTVDYIYEDSGGSLIEVGNQDQGTSPAFRLNISYEFEGEGLNIRLFNCKTKGLGITMKQGAQSPLKFEIMCAQDRDDINKRVWEASFSS